MKQFKNNMNTGIATQYEYLVKKKIKLKYFSTTVYFRNLQM